MVNPDRRIALAPHSLASEGSVERFYEGIVGRLAKTREVDLDSVLIGP